MLVLVLLVLVLLVVEQEAGLDGAEVEVAERGGEDAALRDAPHLPQHQQAAHPTGAAAGGGGERCRRVEVVAVAECWRGESMS